MRPSPAGPRARKSSPQARSTRSDCILGGRRSGTSHADPGVAYAPGSIGDSKFTGAKDDLGQPRAKRGRRRPTVLELVHTSTEPAAVPSLCSPWRSGSRPSGSRDQRALCDSHNPGGTSVATPGRCELHPRAHPQAGRRRTANETPLPAHRGEDPNTARRLALRSERVRSSLFAPGAHSERLFVTWHPSRVSARLALSTGRRNRRGRAALGRRFATFAPARRSWSCRLARPAAPACVRVDGGGRCVVGWVVCRDGCVRRGRGHAGARRLPRRR
jgi:hypothetical protein